MAPLAMAWASPRVAETGNAEALDQLVCEHALGCLIFGEISVNLCLISDKFYYLGAIYYNDDANTLIVET